MKMEIMDTIHSIGVRRFLFPFLQEELNFMVVENEVSQIVKI